MSISTSYGADVHMLNVTYVKSKYRSSSHTICKINLAFIPHFLRVGFMLNMFPEAENKKMCSNELVKLFDLDPSFLAISFISKTLIVNFCLTFCPQYYWIGGLNLRVVQLKQKHDEGNTALKMQLV